MRYKFIKLIFCFSILTNCGFEVVNNNTNYNFTEINTSGNKKINYILRNKLSVNSNNESTKLVKLNITTNQIKSIKEKNIKNQITKYAIKIEAKVEYVFLTNGTSNNFTSTVNGFYNVASVYSQTLDNEKNLVNLLVDNLSEDILETLNNELNDL